MQLKNQVEWALHCCAVIAILPEERFVSTKTLALIFGLPKEYLSKALQSLSRASLLKSTLGNSGGYRLAKPASEISVLDIVEAVEGSKKTYNVTSVSKVFYIAGNVRLDVVSATSIMMDADEAWRSNLKKTSLFELSKVIMVGLKAEELRRRLSTKPDDDDYDT